MAYCYSFSYCPPDIQPSGSLIVNGRPRIVGTNIVAKSPPRNIDNNLKLDDILKIESLQDFERYNIVNKYTENNIKLNKVIDKITGEIYSWTETQIVEARDIEASRQLFIKVGRKKIIRDFKERILGDNRTREELREELSVLIDEGVKQLEEIWRKKTKEEQIEYFEDQFGMLF